MVEIISNAKREADLADQIVSRTHEAYQYDLNISNYEAMLAALPQGEWPARLEQFRGLPDHDAAFKCDAEDVELLAQYQLRDRVSNLIKSEVVEKAKVTAILAVLDGQLTGGRREAALTAAIARREAALGG